MSRTGARDSGGVLSRGALVGVAIVVVVLVVVDVVLVALALSRTAPSDNGHAGPVPTFTSAPGPSPTGTSTPSATAVEGAAGSQAAGRRLLTVVSAVEAWRAVSSTCKSSAATLEHTTDGGTTWRPVELGDDVGSVLALRATTSSISVLVGVGDACDPVVRTSSDGGLDWAAGTPGAAGAGLVTAGLVLSTGTETSPCSDPVDAFQGKYTTAVACNDEVQWRNGSRAWVEVPIRGVRAIADNGSAYTIARVGMTGCAGVGIASLPAVDVSSATEATPIGCASGPADGPIALDRAGQVVWLWAGGGTAVSSDGGATW